MKKHLLPVALFLLISIMSTAQNQVQLLINHKLGDADFSFDTNAKNNLNNDFEIFRLEYYISEITIIHDGGNETKINDVWVLANASRNTGVDLGSHNINQVEMIKFSLGVDPAHNHLDPSTFPALHPLAPKNPSMHWGWVSGYRFVALEGNGGSNLNRLFELHGLGDDNYFTIEIPLTTTANNNTINISLDADYTRALENIDVNAGLIVHGDYGMAKKSLENFRDFVFSASTTTTSTIDFSEVEKFDVFPNPTNRKASLILNAPQDQTYQISVTNILGKEMLFINTVSSNSEIEIPLQQPGIYFVNLLKSGHPVITRKLISK